MEAFLLNPTQPNDRYTESQSLTLNTPRRSDQLASHPSKRTLRHSKESFSDPKVEALYWQRYDSDEEALSSADSDTDSIASASSYPRRNWRGAAIPSSRQSFVRKQ